MQNACQEIRPHNQDMYHMRNYDYWVINIQDQGTNSYKDQDTIKYKNKV